MWVKWLPDCTKETSIVQRRWCKNNLHVGWGVRVMYHNDHVEGHKINVAGQVSLSSDLSSPIISSFKRPKCFTLMEIMKKCCTTRERLRALQAINPLFLRCHNTICQIVNTHEESKGCIILEQRRRNAEDDGNVSSPRQWEAKLEINTPLSNICSLSQRRSNDGNTPLSLLRQLSSDNKPSLSVSQMKDGPSANTEKKPINLHVRKIDGSQVTSAAWAVVLQYQQRCDKIK